MSLDARLIKRLPNFTLDVHLQATKGITALLGPSGAGKSLALNCIGGFIKPDEGRILLDDKIYFDATSSVHLPPRVRRCGYIFQDHALFPHMTVRENLQLAAGLSKSSETSALHRRRRIAELLESFELSEYASRKAAYLSGGQKQRAALARILISEPRLLLLDEPSRGLDTRLRESFYTVLLDTQRRLDIPVLLVTHELSECFRLAGHLYLIESGKIIGEGKADVLLNRPKTLAAAQALGIFNLFPAEITALDPGRRSSLLRVLDRDIEGPYFPGHLRGDRGYLCVRHSETDAVPPERANCPVLTITGVEESAAGTLLLLNGGFKAVIRPSDWPPGPHPVEAGLRFNPEALHFLV